MIILNIAVIDTDKVSLISKTFKFKSSERETAIETAKRNIRDLEAVYASRFCVNLLFEDDTEAIWNSYTQSDILRN